MQNARSGKRYSTVDLSYKNEAEIHSGRTLSKREVSALHLYQVMPAQRIKSPYKQKQLYFKKHASQAPDKFDLLQNIYLMSVVVDFIADERLSKVLLLHGSKGPTLRAVDKENKILTQKHEKEKPLGYNFIANKKNCLRAMKFIETCRLMAKGVNFMDRSKLDGYNQNEDWLHELGRYEKSREKNPLSGLVVKF